MTKTPTLKSNTGKLASMGYLSLLFFLLFLTSLTVMSQDTVTTAKPDTSTNRQKIRKYRTSPPRISDLFASPQERRRQHHQQDSIFNKVHPEHHHPGIYLDVGFGGAFAGISGLEGNFSLNYENNNSLFTFRGLGTVDFTSDVSTIFFLPDFKTNNSLGEYALLYGRRFINDKHTALSLSLGISSDRRTFYYYYPHTASKTDSYYAGLPFEINYHWFTGRFGVGGGFKVTGNLSKYSFIGLGIDQSVGFHKSH